MRRRTKIIAGAAVIVAVAGTAGVAAAAGSDEDSAEGPDTAITGDALPRAEDAALAETGGGPRHRHRGGGRGELLRGGGAPGRRPPGRRPAGRVLRRRRH